jgi:hypothetical protein
MIGNDVTVERVYSSSLITSGSAITLASSNAEDLFTVTLKYVSGSDSFC